MLQHVARQNLLHPPTRVRAAGVRGDDRQRQVRLRRDRRVEESRHVVRRQADDPPLRVIELPQRLDVDDAPLVIGSDGVGLEILIERLAGLVMLREPIAGRRYGQGRVQRLKFLHGRPQLGRAVNTGGILHPIRSPASKNAERNRPPDRPGQGSQPQQKHRLPQECSLCPHLACSSFHVPISAPQSRRVASGRGGCISYCSRSGATVQVALARTVGGWGT